MATSTSTLDYGTFVQVEDDTDGMTKDFEIHFKITRGNRDNLYSGVFYEAGKDEEDMAVRLIQITEEGEYKLLQ